MSHFCLENDINGAMVLDAPITRGPLPRWQRKALESSNTSINSSLNVSTKLSASLASLSIVGNKTPGRTPSKTTPGRSKSAANTPARVPKTPTGGDRFIPNRSTTQFDLGHFMIMRASEENAENETVSPNTQECQRLMNENLNGCDLNNVRIISYQKKAPTAPEGHLNSLRVLYSNTKLPGASKKLTRHIPETPERILDAPDIVNDYYLNLVDWSCNNHLATALRNSVYLWNASTGGIQQLVELEGPEEYVSSVSWVAEGNFLAVGTSTGEVQLWDVEKTKRSRVMKGHSARVGSLSWNNYILSSGSRSGHIHHHDVRQARHQVASIAAHTQEVCGLKWSPEGRYLASGGNDNLLQVWSASAGQAFSDSTPLHSFSQHQAAVKALAWCPWHSSVLASGGGTNDRCIRFWNCSTGNPLSSVDTHSQVCALLWSSEYKEIISGHGYANNQLIIWKYPQMVKVAELTGHVNRVLNMAMSPDGSMVVSAGADETLRLWKCFVPDPARKKEAARAAKSSSILCQRIR